MPALFLDVILIAIIMYCRVLDYDTYSAHDAIGKVYVDLNPLLSKETPNMISGWFPIYDTMHGECGATK